MKKIFIKNIKKSKKDVLIILSKNIIHISLNLILFFYKQIKTILQKGVFIFTKFIPHTPPIGFDF